MAQFDLTTDAWTEIVAAGGSKPQQVSVSFGRARITYGAPGAATKEQALAAGDSFYVPTGVAVSARPAGPRSILTTGDASVGGPSIGLSASSVSESATSGTKVADLSVLNHPSGSSGWSFAETADPDGKFAVAGTALNTAASLNADVATGGKASHSITITASKGGQVDIVQTFTITVTNVLEVTLGALALSGLSYSTTAATSGTITGKTSGSIVTRNGALPAGLTLDLAAMTWAWGGGGFVSTGSFDLVETHPDATNSGRVSPQNWAIVAAPPVILVALLGQSNMPGRALPDGTETDQTDVSARINDPAAAGYQTTSSDITPLKFPEGIQPYEDPTPDQYPGGPGLHILAKIKAQNPTAKVIAVPCAVGSTGLVQPGNEAWLSSLTPGAGGSRFEDAVAAVNDEGAKALAMYPGANISVITFWVQGENDASGAVGRAAYRTALTNLVSHWRTRVTAGTHGQFVIGSMLPQTWVIGSGQYNADVAAINAAQVDVSLNVANVLFVVGPSDHSTDNLHYGPIAVLDAFGDRMGDALTDVTGPSVTNDSSQGGLVGSPLLVNLTHDDPLGHATFHLNGGADVAQFEISDPYVSPKLRWTGNGNGPAVGSYVVKVRARDGAGNYGADKTFTVEQTVPSVTIGFTALSTNMTGADSHFGYEEYVEDIKEGWNAFVMRSGGGSSFGGLPKVNVNGVDGALWFSDLTSAPQAIMGFYSAVDVDDAVVQVHHTGGSIPLNVAHGVATGVGEPTDVDYLPLIARGSPVTGASFDLTDGGFSVGWCVTDGAGATSGITGVTALGADSVVRWFIRETDGPIGFNYSGSFAMLFSMTFPPL